MQKMRTNLHEVNLCL